MMKMKKRWIIGGVILLLIIGGIFAATRPKAVAYKTVTAGRQTVKQEVDFTGYLQSKHKVNMAFELTGTVADVAVDVGDVVHKGDVLLRLDTRGAQLTAAQATAARASGQEQARVGWQGAENAWDKTRATNAQTIAADQQAVRNAKTAYDQIKDVYDQTVRESGDQVAASKTKYSTVVADQAAYAAAQKALTVAQASTAQTTQAARDAADSAYAKYAATVQAAGDTPGVSALAAGEALANLQLAKGTALAPFDGVVTARNISSGELETAGKSLLTIETTNDLEITANVPESDVTKLAVDQVATFTLDAYATTGEVVPATVTKIAPAATTVEGVPTYAVTLALTKPDVRLKPGMTANVIVRAAQKDNVVALPRRAVTKQADGSYTVKILQADKSTVDKPVTLGLQGSDGAIEITSGLNGGETIVLPQVAAGQ
jgi:HlyD family secretion protein